MYKQTFDQGKKILLVSPANHYATGVRQLASILLEHGYSVNVLIFKDYRWNSMTETTEKEWEIYETYIKEYAPDLVGISLTSTILLDEHKLFSTTRRAAPEGIVIVGGYGPTFEPERFLDLGADYVVRGEGDQAIIDIVEVFHANGNLKTIKNVVWKEHGKVHANPLRPLLRDLSSLPGFLHGDAHIVHIENNTIKNIDPVFTTLRAYILNTSRGCVGNCTYCSGGNWFKIYRENKAPVKRYRVRPTESILKELEDAKAAGVRYVTFFDEYFVRSPHDFYAFFNGYKERVGLPFSLMVHTEFLIKDESRFRAFFESGVQLVDIGVQSASERVVKDIFHRKINIENTLSTIYQFHKHYISTAVDIITAHILEEEKDFFETLSFIKKLPFDPSWPERTFLHVHHLSLMPGASIDTLFPELRSKTMLRTEKNFRIESVYLRHVVKDDKEFDNLYTNKYLREHPEVMRNIRKDIMHREAHKYWQGATSALSGKEVYFWGCSDIYQRYKHNFYQCKPKAMLLDIDTTEREIDGIKISHPKEVLIGNDNTPIIIFGNYAHYVAQKILRQYPQYTNLYTRFPSC